MNTLKMQDCNLEGFDYALDVTTSGKYKTWNSLIFTQKVFPRHFGSAQGHRIPFNIGKRCFISHLTLNNRKSGF